MSVRTDVINLNININGNAAQNKLNDLRKKSADLSFELKGLTKGTAEWIAKSKELAAVTGEMDNLKKTMGLAALSQKELLAELRKLKALKGSVQPFSDEFRQLQHEIREVENRLYDVRNGVQGFSSFFSKISDQVKQFTLLAAGAMGVQFIVDGIKAAFNASVAFSDQLADLQRVAGMSKTEAQELGESLANIDTRTSVAALLDIAIVAGKLGVAKKDILSFTEATDKLVVALGDELGDAGAITDRLGKILNVFDGEVTGDNITRLGNAFVELANTGSASAAFIADFDQRLSGIAKSAGIGLGSLSGLGAGIEELGGRVESSSTAVQTLIIKLNSDIPGAARVAGKTTAEFTKTLKEDGVEALLQYSEGLVKNKKSFGEVTAAMKDNGEEGARSIELITKLGSSTDYLRKRVELGNRAIQESTAINEAFRVKNETLGASVDKLGNAFGRLVMSSGIVDFFSNVADALTDLITPVKSAKDQFYELDVQVSNLEQNIVPLLSRYEQLKSKTTLNKNEQAELSKIIQEITTILPGAATEFDKYGRVISINTGRVKEYIKAEKARLQVVNANAIEDYNDKLSDTRKELEKIRAINEKIAATGTYRKRTDVSAYGGTTTDVYANQKDIAEVQNKYRELLNKELGYQTQLKLLKGDALDEQEKAAEEARKKAEDDAKKSNEKIVNDTSKADKERAAKETAQRAAEAKRKREEAEREFEALKKQAAKFYEDVKKIGNKAALNGESPDQKERDAVTLKYNELLEKANEFYKKHAISEALFLEESLILRQAWEDEIDAIIKKGNEKRFKELTEKEYDDSIAARQAYSEELKLAASKDYAAGIINKKQLANEIKIIERNEKADLILIAEDYSGTVKKAATDVYKFRKAAEESTTKDTIEEIEKRKDYEEREAASKVKRAVLKTKPGTKENRDAKKAEALFNFEKEVADLDKGSEQFLLRYEQFQEELKTIENEYLNGLVDKWAKVWSTIADNFGKFNQILNNIENGRLAKEKSANDRKVALYKKQLDSKLISQYQYDKKVNEINEQQDKKEKELKRRQAQRDKALNIFKAVGDVAAAVVKSFLNAGGFPAGIGPAAAMAVLGGIQIATIASTPLPELGTGGLLTKGDKHSNRSGGISAVDRKTGRLVALVERNEAILSSNTMDDGRQHTVSGTARQISSYLNGANGGATWASGARVIRPAWLGQRSPAINTNMPRIMADGGVIRDIGSSTSNNAGNDIMMGVLSELKAQREAINNWNRELHAVVSIKEYRNKEQQYEDSRRASGLG